MSLTNKAHSDGCSSMFPGSPHPLKPLLEALGELPRLRMGEEGLRLINQQIDSPDPAFRGVLADDVKCILAKDNPILDLLYDRATEVMLKTPCQKIPYTDKISSARDD